MSIRAWTEDFVSGLEVIDEHHKELFAMINTFSEEHNETAKDTVVTEFLDALLQYCGYHFSCEEALMRQYEYPLVDFHISIHNELTKTVLKVRGQVKKGEIEDPYTAVIGFATEWLNDHIARDDLTFLSFYKNRDYDLSENFRGRRCMISRFSDNEILGIGRIREIRKNEVYISNSSDAKLPLALNDSVKVMTSTPQSGTQMFIAKTFYSGIDELKLFNATVVMTINSRKHFRVASDIEATLWIGDEQYPAKIINIGPGGILLNTYQALEPSQTVKVGFVVENNRFLEVCQERNTIKRIRSPNSYGMQFTDMEPKQYERLITYVFNRQTLVRKQRT